MICCVENEMKLSFPFDEEALAEKVVAETLKGMRIPFDPSINVMITDSERIRKINRDTRQIDAPTDVLSFPAFQNETPGVFDDAMPGDPDPATGAVWIGDIVVSADAVREQAASYGHSEKREYAFLIAHGCLHLAGYDHMEDKDAKRMEEKQEEILGALQITREERDG